MELKKKEISTKVLHKELDLIQDCIKRMADNSFSLKKWTVVLVGGVITLASQDNKMLFSSISLLILIILFWGLDTYYLWTERMYRAMYKEVIKQRLQGCDSELYDLNPKRFESDVHSFYSVMFSKTLWPFYGIPIALLVIFLICSHWCQIVHFLCNYCCKC